MVYDDDESPTDFHDIPAESLLRREKERREAAPPVDAEIRNAIRKILECHSPCDDAMVEAILRHEGIAVSRSTVRTIMAELRVQRR